jgi:hypothetical protein
VDAETADRMLAKLRDFVAHELDGDERSLFAALIAPGVARAYSGQEVEGFGAEVLWQPGALPEALAEAVRRGGIRVEGLGP